MRQIKIQNRILEQKVVERTEEIRNQKEHIEEQRNQILVQKEHMEDNIEVAKMVQMAVLPSPETIDDRFGETFTLFYAKGYRLWGFLLVP